MHNRVQGALGVVDERAVARPRPMSLNVECISIRSVMLFPLPPPPVPRKCAGVSEIGSGDMPQRKLSFSGSIGSPCGDGGWSVADING